MTLAVERWPSFRRAFTVASIGISHLAHIPSENTPQVCMLLGGRVKSGHFRRSAPTTKPNASSRPPSAEWAYAHVYDTSAERTAHLAPWIHRYNWHRLHANLKVRSPISRIGLTGDNVLRYRN